MLTTAAFDPASRRSWHRRLARLFILWWATVGAAMAAAAPNLAAPTGYRVVRLSTDPYSGAILNARGQVAFTTVREGRATAQFYDGVRIRDFGTLGGTSATVAALNDLGQVAFNVDRGGTPRAVLFDGQRVRDLGTLGGAGATVGGLNRHGQVAGTSGLAWERSPGRHVYRWSAATGMVDLGVPGRGDPVVNGINARGQVFGWASFGAGALPETHGFFWSPQSGLLDIGALGEFSIPTAMNDAGTIVGYGGRGPRGILAFRWTRHEGIRDMGTLPDEFTWAVDVNEAGQVVGATPFTPSAYPHPFLWAPGQGLLDLGVGTTLRGAGTKVTEHGMVIGYLRTGFVRSRGFIWTRETGLIEIGVGPPEVDSAVNDVNERGQVVGQVGRTAFRWTRNQGVVDLNTLLSGAPPGLVLTSANAISASGAILAAADSGLYLLAPTDGE